MNQTLLLLQQKSGNPTPDGTWGPGTFKSARNYFNLSQIRAAHFFGQCSIESAGFTRFEEDLNYSAARLVEVFPSHFHDVDPNQYAHNPEKIANRVYANRNGNGDEASGDGWKYRGRGAIQLTGKSNYIDFAHYSNNPLILKTPDIVATELAFDSAMYYFDKNGIWKIADGGINKTVVTKVTKCINKALLGLNERLANTQKFVAW